MLLASKRASFGPAVRIFVLMLLGFAVWPVDEARAAVIGGWNLERGGQYSLAETNAFPINTIRKYPGATFTGASTLTPAYMATLDAVVLITAFNLAGPVSPLSESEQAALMEFVLNGGRAAFLAEREGFSDLINDSLLHPFGLNIVGDVGSDATVIDPFKYPFTSGPNGVVWNLEPNAAGYFDQLGSAEVVATLDANGEPVLVYIPPNALAPGSGPVLAAADSDMFLNGSGRLAFNTLSFLIAPEPSSFCLAAIAAVGMSLVACRRRLRIDGSAPRAR